MANVYECQVCHTIKEGADELCEPVEKHDICSPQVDRLASRQSQCKSIETKSEHYCAGCGRPSIDPAKLCIPQQH